MTIQGFGRHGPSPSPRSSGRYASVMQGVAAPGIFIAGLRMGKRLDAFMPAEIVASAIARIGTEDLITEVLARCDHRCIGLMTCRFPSEGDVWVEHRWEDNSHTVMGLAADLVIEAQRDFKAHVHIASPEKPADGPRS